MKQFRLDSLRVVTAGKERLSMETALERLQPGLFVLHHRTSAKLDSRYLNLLAPSTLILLETSGEAPTAAPGVPTPYVPAPVPPAPAKPSPSPAVPGST